MIAPAQPRPRASLVTFLVLLLVFFVGSIWMVSSYLLSVLTGVILALITRPLYRFLRAKHLGPKLSAGLVVGTIAMVVLGPLTAFVLAAVDEGVSLTRHLTETHSFSFPRIVEEITRWKPVQSLVGDAPAVEAQLKSGLRTAGTTATALVLGLAQKLPELGLQLVLALLTCFFVLMDGKRFMEWMRDKLPLERDVRERLFGSFRDTAVSVILATVVAALVQAVIMVFAFLILGVPAAFLAGGATFILAWIPIIGSTPVWLGGAIYLYLQGSLAKGLVMVGFGVVCSISDNLIRPMILKGRGDMHPLVSLVAIFGGVQIFGILGVFFGPIIAAILISLLQTWPAIASRFELTEKAISDIGPVPPPSQSLITSP